MPNFSRSLRLIVAAGLLTVAVLRLAPSAGTASAAVGHVNGYRATVLGFSSWYGSYDLGELGVAWCIDHGLRAPDPDLGYQPTTVAEASADTTAALAWALGRYGSRSDQLDSAALMLVGHDLMGAQYPYGRLNVDMLTEGSVAGFGADGPALITRARAIKADALAHAHLRSPWLLEATADDPAPGEAGALVTRLTAGGAPVAGIELTVHPDGVALTAAATAVTDANGVARFGFIAAEGPYRFGVETSVPDLDLQAFAPTAARAQRVARPATVVVTATVERVGQVPTTTTTTTTTVPPTTTTQAAPTPTTAATTTTVPPPLTPTTAASAPAPAPAGSPPGPTVPRSLPRTGADPLSLAAVGSGMVLVGTSLRPRTPRRRDGRA